LAALALEKARLHRSLFRIAEALNSSLDLKSVLQGVLEATVEEMWIKAASVRFMEDGKGILRLMADYGLSDSYRAKGDVHIEKSEIDKRVVNGGEVVVLYDVEHETGFEYQAEAAREGILSVLAVPIKLRGRILGVLRVYSARPRHFGSVAITFLQSVADLVGLATENAQMYAALREHNKNLKTDLADWHRFLALG
jgi:GAF domain-containing protein